MSQLVIQKVSDESFKKYGRILDDYDCVAIVEAMQTTPLPEGVIYEPSVEVLENLPIAKALEERAYGGLPIQVGYCNGHNVTLNALEYHRSSEINIAVTDMILLIGAQQDITSDFTYDTALVEAFLVPAGTIIECYATTLHYAPCSVEGNGISCVVVLPKDTNTDLEVAPNKQGEDALLFAKNKWLIAHPESGLDQDGGFIGLKGENITL